MSEVYPGERSQDAAGLPAGSGAQMLERVRELPGGTELIEAAERHGGGVELVGGAVRDILLGVSPRELDVVVRDGMEDLARELAQQFQGELTLHERFGTAVVRSDTANIDLARIRAESYSAPGALPDVTPGTLEQDLQRRDFTVNAIALGLTGDSAGRLRCVDGALEDLAARRLAVLHHGSFRDDPTRILRLARYATRLARFGFRVDDSTAALAEEALREGALHTVSGERLGAELRLAMGERDAVATLAEMDRMGIFTAWESGLSFDPEATRIALRLLPRDGSVAVMLAAALLLELCEYLDNENTEPAIRGFLHDLALPAGIGDKAFGVAVTASVAIARLGRSDTTSDLLEVTIGAPVEALALAGGVCEIDEGPDSYGKRLAEEWIDDRRHVTLEVTGDDLIAAGVPEGPEVGVRLEESYKLLLEERIAPGRESELRAALEARI
jgi:tRNA nucleotidyltransferase (CCA-adding enzyme)